MYYKLHNIIYINNNKTVTNDHHLDMFKSIFLDFNIAHYNPSHQRSCLWLSSYLRADDDDDERTGYCKSLFRRPDGRKR